MSMKLKSLVFCLLLAASCVAPVQAAAPQSNKDIVMAFFRMMFQDREIDEAARLYLGKPYIQHNPYMRDGVEPMLDFFPRYFEQHPQASVDIKRVIAEGDLVMIHNLWKESPEDRGQAVVDIFRVENGKIVEHWDVSQEIPDNPANQNGMF
ncbi:nuclear transport factor 2 family protein [Achromobacter pulmonis]|uniref:nuclear transport factor 2 family protein n=1 Tax=Achromobacter pulmonis TaxID=1389932 RepID=UPI0012CE1DA3|nr:nuclear transport factor 2 family protein [Achromobacter pulmonis]MCF7767659.1 nuclear transport factor 2 family protein [Achromobacter pulmonis]MPT41747.1 polyketide cyclase [Achromobacter sp.]